MLRVSGIGLILTLLVGCAGNPSSDGKTPARFFGASKSHHSMSLPMSPVAGRDQDFESFLQPSPAVVRQALLAEHERWVGTPYRLGGEGDSGIDCSALVQAIFANRFRIDLPRTTESQVLQGKRVEREQLKAGDLVFFRPPGRYRHVGVYVGDGFFLHASTSQGVTLSELDNVYWQRYYWQARRPMNQSQLAQRAALRMGS